MKSLFRQEGNVMTETQRMTIADYRKMGFGYKKIAQFTGMNENTIKSYCRRSGLGGKAVSNPPPDDSSVCMACGKALTQTPGKKSKKFCSDTCRTNWWNTHLGMVNRKAYYDFICSACGKTFTVYGNARRKFCSHNCYIKSRFGDNTL